MKSCDTLLFHVQQPTLRWIRPQSSRPRAQAVVQNSGMKTRGTRFSNLNTIQLEKNRKRITLLQN